MLSKKVYTSYDFLNNNRIKNLPNPVDSSEPATKGYVDQAIQSISSQASLRRVAVIVGDGSSTQFSIQHGLGTRDVIVQAYEASTYEDVGIAVRRTSLDEIVVSFASPPSPSGIVVVVIG